LSSRSTHPNLSVLSVSADGPDTLVTVKAGSFEDRFFPPLLAAQVFLDVRGLIHQECDSRPIDEAEDGQPQGAKDGCTRPSRRWAFAQEIFSNNGRGTESAHFLEHLVLQIATNIRGDECPPLYGETSWDFREVPDVFQICFQQVDPDIIRVALQHSSEVLGAWGYRLDLGPLAASP
jgi:hypothetical protein